MNLLNAVLLWLSFCEGAAAQSPATGHDRWVERTDAELDHLLRSECRASLEDGKPVLMEFSASWCADCRATAKFVAQDAMRSELSSWHHVTINVGRLDRHMALAGRLGLDALGFWVATAPTNCDDPFETWTVLRKSSFEPITGDDQHLNAETLAQWLREAREPREAAPRSKEKTPSSSPDASTPH